MEMEEIERVILEVRRKIKSMEKGLIKAEKDKLKEGIQC